MVSLELSPSLCPSSLCCAFIAFKVDEYNLDADQFVQCFAAPDAQKRVADTVLAMEVCVCVRACVCVCACVCVRGCMCPAPPPLCPTPPSCAADDDAEAQL